MTGAFVGPDGLRIGPLVAAGVVLLLVFITVVARLSRKPAVAVPAQPLGQPSAPVRVSAPAPAPVRTQAAAPVSARPAPVAAKAGPVAAPPVSAARPQAAPKPAAAPAPKAAAKAAAVPAVAASRIVVMERPVTRKLPPELDLKRRDPASKTGAIPPAVKLTIERKAVIAHVEKLKLLDESEFTKRRPTTVSPGRRIASSRTPSS